MAQEFKLKDIASLADIKPGDKVEAEVEGVEDGKVLLLNHENKIHALSARCTHYGAPLKNGVVAPDGRIMCPWHGGMSLRDCWQIRRIPCSKYNHLLTKASACFNVTTGDVEDAPALNSLNKFDVAEKNGAVYVSAAEADIKSGQRNPNIKCSASKPDEKVVVVGG